MDRKPSARLVPQSRDITRGVRFTEREDQEYRDGAVADNASDLSTYLRECIRMGHSMKQAQRLMKSAGA